MNRFSDYLEAISHVNNLANGLGNNQKIQWLFHCGMLFSSKDKWWGDFKFRHAVHEGIDITYYRTQTDYMSCFDDSIKVPAMDEGLVLNICDDFLGTTLVVENESSIFPNKRILFVYAHIISENGLKIGHTIQKGDVIAKVCDTHKNPLLPPHLHFSCFEIPKKILPENLNWSLFPVHPDIIQINPVFL